MLCYYEPNGLLFEFAQKRLVTILSTIEWTFMPKLIKAITSYTDSTKQLYVMPLAFRQTYFRVIKKYCKLFVMGVKPSLDW